MLNPLFGTGFRSMTTKLIALALFSLAGTALAQTAPEVPFPKGYREWTRIKSMIVSDEKHPLFKVFPGIHHVYGNTSAVNSVRSGEAFRDGAMLVLDLLDISDASGAVSEGPRKFLAVMIRDSVRYKATDGWGFEVFAKGKKEARRLKTPADVAACFSCHHSAPSRVFSEYSK